ncbi:uncharacterized protein Z518_02334 [Rhinocladiella mackenziei CBS 650.93]|uniref:C6 zinc finger domain protein n=1 Tax=Rhinocladiella mackenziei CBS 650.93 TaxID=1442369 RepID=A0A0D2JEQ6_9EURO|nr:uncharacterized protein Z518_02334 [Rhinocladiella mackenziei CBS 650.93]KIX07680.1 hypothetical protein Z518_02334 [Rhinocladiella mackenziei CBS 650.93]
MRCVPKELAAVQLPDFEPRCRSARITITRENKAEGGNMGAERNEGHSPQIGANPWSVFGGVPGAEERLAGAFDASFWTGMALQVARIVSSLRHAMIALASYWENVVVPGSDKRSTFDWECGTFTLQQYTIAISEMRKSLQPAGKPSTVELLMSNLLFVCMEMFQNHYESALCQLSNGLYLFCTTSNPTNQQTEMEDELEKQLNHNFKRLMTQSLLFPVRHVDKRLLAPSFTPRMPNIPRSFASIAEARNSLNDCISSIAHESQSRNSSSPKLFLNWAEAADVSFQDQVGNVHNYLEQWSQVFEEFRKREEANLSERERHNCIILEIQRIALPILALAPNSQSEAIFDLWMPEFSRLVDLVSFLIRNKRRFPNCMVLHLPKFDINLILPMYLVASRCRHPELRRQAVELLWLEPRQEGIWNSAILASVAERIILIEERGLGPMKSCEDVPAPVRIKLVEGTILTASAQVVATFSRPAAHGNGQDELLYETISYMR